MSEYNLKQNMSERVTVQIVLDQTYETKVLGILIYAAVGVDLGPIGRRPSFWESNGSWLADHIR